MTTRLSKIDPLSTGKVVALIYFGISLLFIPFFLLGMLGVSTMPNNGDGSNPLHMVAGMGFVFLIFIPILYTMLGFIGGIILALIYNVASHFTGGLEFTFTEVAPALPPGYAAPLPPR